MSGGSESPILQLDHKVGFPAPDPHKSWSLDSACSDDACSTVYLVTIGVWFGAGPILYPNNRLTGFVKTTKTSRAAKLYWRP